MTLGEVERRHVEMAMAECDRVGRRSFVEGNGFGYAHTYLVRFGSSFYDPKALLGMAHGHIDGDSALKPSEFDATEAIARLRTLGFQVVDFNGLWWVNQGSTFKAEQAGGYVWAPQTTKSGRPAAHHVAVTKLRVGQRIVHYSGGIRALGVVAAPPESRSRPKELSGGAWGEDGYYCQVEYRDLPAPIPKEDVPNRTADVGPFDVNGNVKQGYLFRIEDPELFPLLSFLTERVPNFWDDLVPSQRQLPRDEETPVILPTSELHEVLRDFHNVVLEGVPGTGKSYAIEQIAAEWEQRTGRPLLEIDGHPFASAVLHPSTSYEDFIEGLRPKGAGEASTTEGPKYFDQRAGGSGKFAVDDGFFLRICTLAAANPAQDLLVLLDELNRCNVSSVFGDLLLTLEGPRRAKFMGRSQEGASARDWRTAVRVSLPYSGRSFFVPDNVYVVATTNTTDRSVAPLDAAIRRRFAFIRLEPAPEAALPLADGLSGDARQLFTSSCSILDRLNRHVLGACLGPDAMLGHSYLFKLGASLKSKPGSAETSTARLWRYSIVSQLIDAVRAYGAEPLLDPRTRAEWFDDHGAEMQSQARDSAVATLQSLDTFLGKLGMRLVVEGTGLARGVRFSRGLEEASSASPRLDTVTSDDVAVELEPRPEMT